eukprot:jgi/Picsp_1/972/NSC_04456-R1_---NA---
MPRSGLVLPAGRISSGNRRDDRHFMNRRYLFVPICGVTKKNGISGSKSMTEVSLPNLKQILFADSGNVLRRVCSIVPLAIFGVCLMPQSASGWKKSRPTTSEVISYNVADKRKGVWSPTKTDTMTQIEMGAVWDRYMKEPLDSLQHSENKLTQGNIKAFKASKNSNSRHKKIGTVDTNSLGSEAVGYSLNAETVAAGCIGAFCILLFIYYWNNNSREALYGIDVEVQGLSAGSERSADQGSLFGSTSSSQDTRTVRPRKMTREEIMLDASKRIQKAKIAQKKFENQSTPLPLDGKVQSIQSNSPVYQIVDEPGIEVSKVKEIQKKEITLKEDNQKSSISLPKSKDVAVFACALTSVFIDGISTEIRNMLSHNLSSSRSLECTSQTQFAGKPLLIRSRKSTGKLQEVQHATRWKFEEMALAPVAPIMIKALGSKHIEILNEKYNPVFEFQEHMDHFEPPSLESDPILSSIRGLAKFQGPYMPSALQKYDPVSALDQVKKPNNVSNPIKQIIESAPPKESGEPDPFRQLIHSLIAFKGPSTFEWVKKYDLLQRIDEIEESKQPSDYSFLTALIKAKPESEHYDHPWKSLVEIEEPHLKYGERPLKFLLNLAQGNHDQIGEIFYKYDMIHKILGDITVPAKSKHVDQLPVSSAGQPKKTHGTEHDVESERNDSIRKTMH